MFRFFVHPYFHRDLSAACLPFRTIFKMESPKEMKYGQLVLPNLYANFGPMYFCRLTRNE